jgi:SNF2 family DNA or RNA helicase
MVNLDTDRNRLLVTFQPYSDDLYRKMRELNCGRWDKTKRAWRLPLTRLDEVLATFPQNWKEPRLAKYLERVQRSEALRTLEDAPDPVGVVVPFSRVQRIATNFLTHLHRAILLSRGVGCGKTRIGIAWAVMNMEAEHRRGVLVVTKDAGKYPYRSEILRAIPGARVAIVEGEKGEFPGAHAEWCILNWNVLSHRVQQIKDRGFAAVVFSESHKMKDIKTDRAQAGLELSKAIPNILLETASFTPNRNSEAFSQLCVVGLYDKVDDYYPFHVRYCTNPNGPQKVVINRRGVERWDFTHSKNSDELHKVIAPFTFVIDRKDVWPEKSWFNPVLTNPVNATEYRDAEKHFLKWVAEHKGGAAALRAKKAMAISRMNTLLELAALGNVKAAEDHIETCMEAGEKFLVFSSYKKPLHKLYQKFPGISVMITGEESPEEKFASMSAFQNDAKVKGCLCSTEAGGESITLTAASTVIFLSLPWSPSSFMQAHGRADRYGQTKPVQVIVLVGRQTLQIDQVETLYEKELDISMVVSGTDRSPNSEALHKILTEVKGSTTLSAP